ncbi:MAG: DUF4040 domain-containing protein [Myxococcales bacterium]|jgi:multicomponent Na+:H+ antiporter subunit B
MDFPVEIVLFIFLLATAVTVAVIEDLFAAAMITGIFSLLSAGLFTLMDAVDVAFTEAAVGAGVSTVLVLSTLALTTEKENQRPFRAYPLLIVLLTGAALFYGTLDMPHYGDPDAPIHGHVAPRYIEGATTEFGIPNIVTNVLASYRGYDTMGETAVIFTATVGVMLLLGALRRRNHNLDRATMTPDGMLRMRDYAIPRVVSMTLIPLIILFAFYVQFHGDFGPGGGFQAGVIFAAALVLYGLIFGLATLKRVVPPALLEAGIALGLLLYGGTGVVCLLLGGNFLDYAVLDHHSAQHGRHLGIMLVEGGVGIAVTCAMTLIFYAFGERGMARGDEEADD